MANRLVHKLRALTRDIVLVHGSFAPNGSSAVSSASNKGKGWSVARTSAGLFTITFENPYADLVSFTQTLQLASGDDKVLQAGAYSASNKTITIRVWDISGAAVADISANADNRIHFVAAFRNGSGV